MRVASSAAARSNAGRSLVAPGSRAGSGMLQWIVLRVPGNSGQTSRTRSQRVIT